MLYQNIVPVYVIPQLEDHQQKGSIQPAWQFTITFGNMYLAFCKHNITWEVECIYKFLWSLLYDNMCCLSDKGEGLNSPKSKIFNAILTITVHLVMHMLKLKFWLDELHTKNSVHIKVLFYNKNICYNICSQQNLSISYNVSIINV